MAIRSAYHGRSYSALSNDLVDSHSKTFHPLLLFCERNIAHRTLLQWPTLEMDDRYCIMRELIGRRERKQSRAVEIIGGCLKMAVVKNSTRNELPKRKKKQKRIHVCVPGSLYRVEREREFDRFQSHHRLESLQQCPDPYHEYAIRIRIDRCGRLSATFIANVYLLYTSF